LRDFDTPQFATSTLHPINSTECLKALQGNQICVVFDHESACETERTLQTQEHVLEVHQVRDVIDDQALPKSVGPID
jgi:hypothetical protein